MITPDTAHARALVQAFATGDAAAVDVLLARVNVAAGRLAAVDPIGAALAGDADETRSLILGLVSVAVVFGELAAGSRDRLVEDLLPGLGFEAGGK